MVLKVYARQKCIDMLLIWRALTLTKLIEFSYRLSKILFTTEIDFVRFWYDLGNNADELAMPFSLTWRSWTSFSIMVGSGGALWGATAVGQRSTMSLLLLTTFILGGVGRTLTLTSAMMLLALLLVLLLVLLWLLLGIVGLFTVKMDAVDV